MLNLCFRIFPVAVLGVSGQNLGSRGVTQVREVRGIDFHPVAPQTEVVVTSYVQLCEEYLKNHIKKISPLIH